MKSLAGGGPRGRKPGTVRRSEAQPKPQPESTPVSTPTPARRRAPVVSEDEEQALPHKIAVVPDARLRSIVPGSVWRRSAFPWDPLPFSVESERLHDRVIQSDVQDQGLRMFLDDPRTPMIYVVTGAPDDSKAKLFAAYLMHHHLKALGPESNPVWHALYGGFENKLLRDHEGPDSMMRPTMLVLTNLTSDSTAVKLEKARDLIERFDNIPRIVVAAGDDPISFALGRLFVPVNALAFFCETLVRRKMEVV